MQGIIWDEASYGVKFEYVDIPADMVDQANEWREKLVESAAEANEELMDKYLETGELTEEEINQGIRLRTIAGEIQPVLCGTAFKNKGIQRMLDAVIDYLPSPIDIPPVDGVDDEGNPVTREADDGAKFSTGVRLMSDPFVGQLTLCASTRAFCVLATDHPVRASAAIGGILQMRQLA